MNLEQWVQNNPDELNPEEPNPSAIRELVSVAEREIADAKSVSSPEGSLNHAYAACLSISRSASSCMWFPHQRWGKKPSLQEHRISGVHDRSFS